VEVVILPDLKADFERFYESRFGNQELLFWVFYNFPIGIRFEIGVSDSYTSYDEVYVKNALHRAVAIFNELFDKDDIIYIIVNSFEDDPNDLAGDTASGVRLFINHIQNECKFPFVSKDKPDSPPYSESFSCTRHIIQASVKDIQTENLMEAIIWSDIDGRNNFGGCVYFVNPKNGIIYWLYDDRGLDVITNEKTNLKQIYIKFNDWILDYDRERINGIFAV
jgi:hypothetical protein